MNEINGNYNYNSSKFELWGQVKDDPGKDSTMDTTLDTTADSDTHKVNLAADADFDLTPFVSDTVVPEQEQDEPERSKSVTDLDLPSPTKRAIGKLVRDAQVHWPHSSNFQFPPNIGNYMKLR